MSSMSNKDKVYLAVVAVIAAAVVPAPAIR